MNQTIDQIRRNFLWRILRIFSIFLSDETFTKIRYFYTFHRMPNLLLPKLFNEKVIWRMLFDRSPRFQQLADKIAVRDYVKGKNLGHLLSEQYFVTDDPSTIVIESLPNTFILKPNHASGMVKAVYQKQEENWQELLNLCRDWLRIDFSKRYREWQYKHIQPQIIVEEFLGRGQGAPEEYKFHCFDGEPKLVLAVLDRFTQQHIEGWYDLDWHPRGLDSSQNRSQHIPRPDRLNELVEVARQLASDFDYLRVDLYLLPERIVFSELASTPGAGTGLRSTELQEYLGALWKLNTSRSLGFPDPKQM